MNTAELVDKIAAHDDKITKTQAKAIVDGVFNAIRDAAKKGEEVSLPGFRAHRPQPEHRRGHPDRRLQEGGLPAGQGP
jgi:DNA-binding protein HU-beta